MAYYRHFVERNDFEIFVATDDPNIRSYSLPYEYIVLRKPAWLDRISRTRLSLWAHSFHHLILGRFIYPEVMKAARKFRPDVVLTGAGSWSWLAMMSERLAESIKVPLASSFMDWYDYNLLVHPWFKKSVEAQFYAHYRRSDLALCTSEGMKEALGEHRNAVIHYPTGALRTAGKSSAEVSGKVFRVGFAGNLGEWYGGMLERLVREAETQGSEIEFRFFGSNARWSEEFELFARQKGIFRGQVPFEQLRDALRDVSILILPMGFEEKFRRIESTSFKTKFLDYIAFEKPILVWGPEYCSAIRTAREFDSAECCTSPSEKECLRAILRLAGDPARRSQLLENSKAMYQERFHPDTIHSKFTTALNRLALGS